MFEYYLKNKNIYTQTIHLGFFSRFFNLRFLFLRHPPQKKQPKNKNKNPTTIKKVYEKHKRH